MPSDAPERSSRPTETRSGESQQQRDRLLDSERAANRDQPRNFKDDALTDKQVHIDPDGTGPSPTDTMDPERDRRAARGESGSERVAPAAPSGAGTDPPEPRDEGPLESLGRAVSAPVVDAAQRTRADSDEPVDRSGAADTPRTG